jgi:glutamate 5-kinase
MQNFKKIVVKVGTSTLTQGSKKLSRRYMLELAGQIAHLHGKGLQIVLVTSGAVAAGREVLLHPNVDRSLPSKQMFAAIGQVQLMQIWRDLFNLFSINVGQLLLTRDDFSHRKRYLNTRDTVNCFFQHSIIPIINENDTVATKEIRVGDNDNLAALAANLIGADLLILLTDQQGLFTADPRSCTDAKLIPTVKQIDESIFGLAQGSSTALGTGGMITKIEAAQIATRCGTKTIIASSSHPNVLIEIAEGKQVGTYFHTDVSPQESRKRWILAEKKQGLIHVDEGAALKITHHGASLLPSGISKAMLSFDRGAVVHLVDPSGKSIAAGITNYSDQEIQKMIGLHSKGIEEVLGYSYGPEVIHRTNMTRLKNCEENKNEAN